MSSPVTISGDGLSIADIVAVAHGAPVALTSDPLVRKRIADSCRHLATAVANDLPIYGVTTLFGGLADHHVPKELVRELQMRLVRQHKSAAGERLPATDVRAAMLLRANSLLRGVSAIRLEIIERLVAFLNGGLTPHVFEHGSIGASGDLVPLAYIAGAILGLHPDFTVEADGASIDSHRALAKLGLKPLGLEAKEGLALLNGTSVCTGVAANCMGRAQNLLALCFGVHALYIQALRGTDQSFHAFIHAHKPHPGQRTAARAMTELLAGSKMIHDEASGDLSHRDGDLIQDRYSLRCLPQYFGPIVEGIDDVARQMEVEANSATDNPLVDAAGGRIFHCGNFLAQYVGVGMDRLRYYLGLLAKHLDVQIALLVAPEFSNGLPASLIGNTDHGLNIGFKALQLVCNSLMPQIGFYGNSLADRYPTHAEQFNQNINSQGMGSAVLARRSLDLFEHYVANALLFGVQAVELRTKLLAGHYDARACLSPGTAPLYEAVNAVLGRSVSRSRPLVFNDDEQFLDALVAPLLENLRNNGRVLAAAARPR